jgi:hypothetical protein
MKISSWAMLAATVMACLSGCYANVGTNATISVPKDAAATCSNHCAGIGMSLDSVVIMASNVGCVCRAKATAQAQGSENGGVSAGGMAALIVQEEQERQRQRQQQQAQTRR